LLVGCAQDAVLAGIMVPARGVYRDPATGVELPIATAMNAGQIVVDFTTKTRSVEKTEAIGLITIRTLVRTPPLSLPRHISSEILDPPDVTSLRRLYK